MPKFNKWVITGDTHQQFGRFKNLDGDENTAVVILGDVGLNFKLDSHDYWAKKGLCKKYPFTFYCVKGNHEERPSNVKGMKLIFDKEVCGEVWIEEDFPQIRYFKEWGIYNIGGYKTLIIGGAYSVDKWIRLQNDWPWFPSEQLTEQEMEQCYQHAKGKEFDLVLSHTCPYSWMPTDLFINGVKDMDSTMEKWLEKMKYAFKWNVWLFGHFHEDRVERPHVELCFMELEDLEGIMQRWKEFDEGEGLKWWIPKSPNFYQEDIWPIYNKKN